MCPKEKKKCTGLLEAVCHHPSQALIDLWHYLLCLTWHLWGMVKCKTQKLKLTDTLYTYTRTHTSELTLEGSVYPDPGFSCFWKKSAHQIRVLPSHTLTHTYSNTMSLHNSKKWLSFWHKISTHSLEYRHTPNLHVNTCAHPYSNMHTNPPTHTFQKPLCQPCVGCAA